MRVRSTLWFTAIVFAMLACGPPAAAPPQAASLPPAPPIPATAAAKVEAPVSIPTEPALALLDVVGRFTPESLSALGLPGHEEDIADLGADVDERADRAVAAVARALADEEARETETERKLDVQLVLRAAKLQQEQSTLERALFLPYKDAARIVYHGLKAQLKTPGAEGHAFARLVKYAGDDHTPSIFERVESRTVARIDDPKLLYPTKGDVDDELKNLPVFLDDLGALFAKQTVVPRAQWEPPFARLREKSTAHVAFLQARIVPRARTDFRLPLPFYDFLLKQAGVTICNRSRVARPRAWLRAPTHAARRLVRMSGREQAW